VGQAESRWEEVAAHALEALAGGNAGEVRILSSAPTFDSFSVLDDSADFANALLTSVGRPQSYWRPVHRNRRAALSHASLPELPNRISRG
jgi:hypothetical protein